MIRVTLDLARPAAESGWCVRSTVERAGPGPLPLAEPFTLASFPLDGRQAPLPGAAPDGEDDEGVLALCRGDIEAHRALAERLRHRTPADGDAGRYGRWLFECLVAPVWQPLLATLEAAGATVVELALRWPVDDVDLHSLAWEAMRCREGYPLGAHPRLTVAVTRVVPGALATARTLTRLPRALFASGTALVDPTIRPGALFMGLLQSLTAQGRCRTRALQLASLQSLAAACTAFRPDLVQLVAHGVVLPDGGVALLFRRADSSTDEEEVDAADLVTALGSGGRHPTAVLLSACNTASPGPSTGAQAEPGATTLPVAPLAAQLVAAGVPIVSAMSGEVSEQACRLYTRQLADAVHSGRSVVEASAHGRRAALMGTPGSVTEIDWALPTLYLAEGLDPGQRLVDDTLSVRLGAIGDALGLRRDPVFVGRSEVLSVTDDLTANGIGVLSVLSQGSVEGLGGARLLQEIGWRLLRDGHVPLLLGPYDVGGLQTAHDVVAGILEAAVNVLEKLGRVPPDPTTLLLDPGAAAPPPPPPGAGAALRRGRLRSRIKAFAASRAELDLPSVRDTLADDLAAVGVAAQDFGPPFGVHTRVMVLCHNVHAWGAPAADPHAFRRTGLGALLGLLDSTGLGRPAEPVPVVLIGSRTAAAGPELSLWAQNAGGGYRVLGLGALEPDEAVVGFQWVLMHRWQAKADVEPELYGRTYTARPAKAVTWERALRDVGGRPAQITRDIFIVARSLAHADVVLDDDDEGAWREYARLHLGGAS